MKFKLISTRPETVDVTTFVWEPSEPLSWQAGQYMEYHMPHEAADDRGIIRWFTNSAAPHEKHVQITTRLTSPKGSSFKGALQKLPIGSTIEADGPMGDFVITDTSREYVMIAGGIGITPIRSMLVDLNYRDQPINVTLLYASRSEDNVVFKSELDNLALTHPTLQIHYVYEPQRIDKTIISQYVTDFDKPLFYVSGPEPMVKAMAQTLQTMGVPEANLKLDDFPGYE